MEVEISGAARDRRLDKLVAATVLGLTVFVAFCKIKDDNIVQAMQVAKADAVDTWMGVAGFAAWPIHPDAPTALLT